jgi:hypothetical protein
MSMTWSWVLAVFLFVSLAINVVLSVDRIKRSTAVASAASSVNDSTSAGRESASGPTLGCASRLRRCLTTLATDRVQRFDTSPAAEECRAAHPERGVLHLRLDLAPGSRAVNIEASGELAETGAGSCIAAKLAEALGDFDGYHLEERAVLVLGVTL